VETITAMASIRGGGRAVEGSFDLSVRRRSLGMSTCRWKIPGEAAVGTISGAATRAASVTAFHCGTRLELEGDRPDPFEIGAHGAP